MFCSREMADRIEAEIASMHSGPKKDVSLCQYEDKSCVRCCLPHIGGDSWREIPEDEWIKQFNKSNLECRNKYDDRYVGPGGILMKFAYTFPLAGPNFAISHYEDSFNDVGQEEMERRFGRRREVFEQTFDPKNPEATTSEYMEKIRTEEGYNYSPNLNDGMVAFFMGSTMPIRDQSPGKLPECQALGFCNKEGDKPGCMIHSFAHTSKGHDGREQAGFFEKTDSCTRASCSAAEEFPYLSGSALKAFRLATEGMSWYDYSRHSTGVLVSYLRAYDPIIQMIDKAGKLNGTPLERLVEFTNDLFDNWELKRPNWNIKRKLSEMVIPRFPEPGVKVSSDKMSWFTGTPEQANRIISGELKWRDDEYKTVVEDREYTLSSTESGYVFDMMNGQKIHADIIGNKPVFRTRDMKEAWRTAVEDDSSLSTSRPERIKQTLYRKLSNAISFWGNDAMRLGRHEILGLKSMPIDERIMHVGLTTHFLRGYIPIQIKQARQLLKERVSKF